MADWMIENIWRPPVGTKPCNYCRRWQKVDEDGLIVGCGTSPRRSDDGEGGWRGRGGFHPNYGTVPCPEKGKLPYEEQRT